MKEKLKKLGKLIKIERIKNEYTQEELAERVGVSPRTISLIEGGLQHPKFFLVLKIAQILNFDINIIKEN